MNLDDILGGCFFNASYIYFKQMRKVFVIFLTFFTFFNATPVLAFTSGPVNPYAFGAKAGGLPGTVDLVWNDDGTTNTYDVIFGTDPKKFVYGQVGLPFTKNGANQYTVRGLNPGTTYYFSLVGETSYGTNNSGPISFVAPVRGMYPSLVPASQNPNGVLGVVSASGPGGPIGAYNFTSTSGSGGTIRLTWTDNGSSTHYNIAYGFAPGKYNFGLTNLPFTPNTTNTYYVSSLQKGTRYYFELTTSTDSAYVSRSGPISAIAQ
jgi:hypothetical protein